MRSAFPHSLSLQILSAPDSDVRGTQLVTKLLAPCVPRTRLLTRVWTGDALLSV